MPEEILQIHNPERRELMAADMLRNGFQNLHEPLGDIALWNGQFEQPEGSGSQPGCPEGWNFTPSGNGVLQHVTGGLAGNWCMRAGQVGTGRGGYLHNLRYIPVDEDRDYYLSCAVKGSHANASIYIGANCYDANKASIASAWCVGPWTPGTSWDRRQFNIGPSGDVAWPANTRYARPRFAMQWDNTLTNEWMYIDDVQFGQLKKTYSPLIRLVDDQVSDGTNRTFNTQAWVAHAGSTLNFTLEEPGHIWSWYSWWGSSNVGRAQCYRVSIYVDAGIVGQTYRQGGVAAVAYIAGMQWRSTILARGAHTVDVRFWVQNAGDTVTINSLMGDGFYVRAY